jgi:hypothetical protein
MIYEDFTSLSRTIALPPRNPSRSVELNAIIQEEADAEVEKITNLVVGDIPQDSRI